MVSADVREVIVAGWWRGWELCSELESVPELLDQQTSLSE